MTRGNHKFGNVSTCRVSILMGVCVAVLPLIPLSAAEYDDAALQEAAAQDAAAQSSGSAETAEPLGGDIIVTATRQARASQSVPIALTAISGDQLVKNGITTAADLSRVAPSLYVLSTVSGGSPRFTLRGLTGTDTLPAGSSAIATYVDDVYQASQFGISSSLYDIQRVEVLRGPQGTTFGKNTTGGAVVYISQTPTNEADGYVSARMGDGDQSQRYLEGAVNVPIVDGKLAMRISGHVESRGAVVPDLATNRGRGALDYQSGRVQLRWTPSSDTSVNLSVFGTRYRGDGPLGRAELPGVLPFDRDAVRTSDRRANDDFDNYGSTLRIEQALGTFSLTSITHYRKTDVDNAQDLDGLGADLDLGGGFIVPGDLFQYRSLSKATQYGQELRLASDSNQPLSGIVGAYFEKDKVDDVNSESSVLNGPPIDYNNLSNTITRTKTYAIFGNLTFRITPDVSFIGGIRKTWETRTVDGTKRYYQDGNYDWRDGDVLSSAPIAPTQTLIYNQRQKATPITWDLTANYNPARSFLLFARVAKGFRSGGFNPADSVFPAALFGFTPRLDPNPFFGEAVKSYELGVKTGLFDNKLRVNATVFHYDYTNQQVALYFNGLVSQANAASAKVDGGEVEFTAFIDQRWDLSVNVSYVDGRYKNYVDPFIGANYSGNQLISSAKWNGNANIGYAFPLSDAYDLRASTFWNYRSRLYFDSANSAALSTGKQASGNLRLALEPTDREGFTIAAFVNNVTNRRALASGFTFFPGTTKYYDVGRLYGLDVTYRW